MTDYTKEVECRYKNRTYSVRDNGEVYRHWEKGRRKTKYDENWTFGIPKPNGYFHIAQERVHRIVAFAFLSQPPTDQHVVDHIDTNRKNNRPENLRWVTKLENALLNEATRKKIKYLCGSIQAFRDDPSILRERAAKDPEISWMKNVTSEEAKNALENITKWAAIDSIETHTIGGSMGEWIYEKPRNSVLREPVPLIMQSLTPNALQKKWYTHSEFPLCPSELDENSLDTYLQELKPDSVFARNKYGESLVIEAALEANSKALVVMCSNPSGANNWSLARIYIKSEKIVHESVRTFMTYEGVLKQFTLSQGLEWTGGDSIDDYL